MIKIPLNIISNSQTLFEFVNEIYPSLKNFFNNYEFMINRAILQPKNIDVEEINNIALNKMTGIVLPAPNQLVQQVGYYINTARSGVQFQAAYFIHDGHFALHIRIYQLSQPNSSLKYALDINDGSFTGLPRVFYGSSTCYPQIIHRLKNS